MSNGISITMYPAKTIAPVTGKSFTVDVMNTGKKPVTLQVNALEIARNSQGSCQIGNKPVSWAHVWPNSMILYAHKTQAVTVTLEPGAKPGTHDLAVTASTVIGHQGTVQIREAVASQALYKVPGTVTATAQPCIALAAPSSGGFPTLLLGGLMLAALLVATVVIFGRKWVRKS